MKSRLLYLALLVSPTLLNLKACPAPNIQYSPPSLFFDARAVNPSGGGSASQTITVTNKGTATGQLATLSVSGSYSMSSNCTTSLGPKQSCTIDVTFDPRQVGTINGQVMTGGTGVVSLTGSGLPPVGFAPLSLDFGSVAIGTSSASKSVILTNNQDTALAINSIVTSGDYGQTNDCPASLTPGSTCTINVVFQPSIKGTIPGAVSVSSDAVLDAQPVGLTGSGSGSAMPKISFSPATMTFGNVEAGTSSGTQTVTLTNTDPASSLTVQSITASSGYSQTNTCSAPLAPNGTCTISVTFRPTANLVSVLYPGSITITESDATATQQVGLTGTSIAPVSASPASLDFGVLNLGADSPPQTVTFSNFDSASEKVSLAIPSPLSASNNSCTINISGGASCAADISFQAINTQAFKGAVTYNFSSGGFLNPQVVNVSGCVTGLIRTPTGLNFGAPGVGQTSATETATLSGDSTTFSDFIITGTNASDFSVSTNSCSSPFSGLCSIDLVFKPSSTGMKTATLNIVDDLSCSPQPVALRGGSGAGPFVITVMPRGSGSGTITSDPAGINCGSQGTACSANFAAGADITLTATPDVSSNFIGWDDACSGTTTCKLKMTADRQVAATFTILPLLSIGIGTNASGSGSVTSSPAGIDCPATACDAYFQPGTTVTLTATPGTGSKFTGWANGSCSGAGTCSLTMNADQHVDAVFNGPPTLSVNLFGTGAGSVTSNPPGINCPSGICQSTFPVGASVTLTATPTGSSTFSGWDNGCSGVGTCTLLMTNDVTEDATFTGPPDFSVSVDPLTPQSIPAGASAMFTLSLNPVNNFGSTVNLGCVSTATAQGVNCQLSSTSLPPGGTATVTVTTMGPSAAVAFPAGLTNRFILAMCIPVAGLTFIAIGMGAPGRRRPMGAVFLLAVLALLILLPGCGGGGHPPHGGTPPGTYSVTINETAGSIQHSTSVTVTVH